MKTKFWLKYFKELQQKPSKERLIELENYINFHGVICDLSINFTNIDGVVIGKEKKIKKRIKDLMEIEFKGFYKILNNEVDLIFKAWLKAIYTEEDDIILVNKYSNDE